MKLRRVASNFDVHAWLAHGAENKLQACRDAHSPHVAPLSKCVQDLLQHGGLRHKLAQPLHSASVAAAQCLSTTSVSCGRPLGMSVSSPFLSICCGRQLTLSSSSGGSVLVGGWVGLSRSQVAPCIVQIVKHETVRSFEHHMAAEMAQVSAPLCCVCGVDVVAVCCVGDVGPAAHQRTLCAWGQSGF